MFIIQLFESLNRHYIQTGYWEENQSSNGFVKPSLFDRLGHINPLTDMTYDMIAILDPSEPKDQEAINSGLEKLEQIDLRKASTLELASALAFIIKFQVVRSLFSVTPTDHQHYS